MFDCISIWMNHIENCKSNQKYLQNCCTRTSPLHTEGCSSLNLHKHAFQTDQPEPAPNCHSNFQNQHMMKWKSKQTVQNLKVLSHNQFRRTEPRQITFAEKNYFPPYVNQQTPIQIKVLWKCLCFWSQRCRLFHIRSTVYLKEKWNTIRSLEKYEASKTKRNETEPTNLIIWSPKPTKISLFCSTP